MNNNYIIFTLIFLANISTTHLYAMMSHFADLHQCIQHGPVDELKTFFQENNYLINKPLDDKNPPPLSYCIHYRHSKTEQDMCDAVQALIDCGAKVNKAKSWNFSQDNPNAYLPIMLWARIGNSIKLLEILLQNGADINQSDNDGTVLQHLIYRVKRTANKDFLPLIDAAIREGADPLKKINDNNKNCFEIINDFKEWQIEPVKLPYGLESYKLVSKEINPTIPDLMAQIEMLFEKPRLRVMTKMGTKVHLTYIFKSIK